MSDQPSDQLKKFFVAALDVFPPKNFDFDKRNPLRRYFVSYTTAQNHDVFVITRMSTGCTILPPPSSTPLNPRPLFHPGAAPFNRPRINLPPTPRPFVRYLGPSTTNYSIPPPTTVRSSTPASAQHYADGRPLTPGKGLFESATSTGPSPPPPSRTSTPPPAPLPSTTSIATTSSSQPSSSVFTRVTPPIDQPILTPPSSSRSTATGSHRSPSPAPPATKRVRLRRRSTRSSATSSSHSSRSSTPSPQVPPPLSSQQLAQLSELLSTHSDAPNQYPLLQRLIERRDSDSTEEILENA